MRVDAESFEASLAPSSIIKLLRTYKEKSQQDMEIEATGCTCAASGYPVEEHTQALRGTRYSKQPMQRETRSITRISKPSSDQTAISINSDYSLDLTPRSRSGLAALDLQIPLSLRRNKQFEWLHAQRVGELVDIEQG